MTKFERKFTMKHSFFNISKLNGDQYSFPENHYGFTWNIIVARDESHLGLYFCCSKIKSQGSSAEVEYTLEVFSPSQKNCVINTAHTFDETTNAFGSGKAIAWKEMIDNYAENDKIQVVCHAKIIKINGLTEKRLREFDESMEDVSDVVLKVEDEKFNVSKLILATHSPYFKTLLLGKMREAKKKEVVLKDIDAKTFQIFLEIIYAESAVNDENVESLLDAATMFDTELVIRKCEEHLMMPCCNISYRDKIRFSSKFNLEKLLTSCVKKSGMLGSIRQSLPDDLTELDPTVLAAFLNKIFKGLPPRTMVP